MAAAARGDVTRLMALSRAGHNFSEPSQRRLTAWSRGPHFPLHYAAGWGHANVVALLLDAGADIDCEDGDGNTPLMWAVRFNRTDTVRQLLDMGAEVSHDNRFHRSAINIVSHVDTDILEAIIRNRIRAAQQIMLGARDREVHE
eukprot:CAMPEP_0173426194 /NCGR_PEP_ID=MMETSP1357-20121228/5731_1 /TAXON_ID=77926 /ORGANISM="Hemiselmis rufescens, Strain PCC563" /LENGTH=143 /DNA_ID=CAMNT_0014389805 /DNA_START=193 /DNA_END=621 /DNA_ORIENTATION=+